MNRFARRLVWLLCVGGLCAVATPRLGEAAARAKAKVNVNAETKADEGEEEGDAGGARRLPTRVTKLRQDSVLRRDKPVADAADLRGSFERRRDHEVVLHYRRVAELDVIAAIARRENDAKLLDRVETVRRKELRRFWAVMQELRAVARVATSRGTP